MFTSDNGYYLGEHLKRQGKINLHEPSLRVPFLISGPGIPHGVRYDPIGTMDIAPTFTAYAGLKGMPHADGINLIPLIKKGDRGWVRPIVMEGRMDEYPKHTHKYGFNSQLNTRGLRLGRWKFTRYSTGEIELYDLKTDPLELNSLTGDPKYNKIKAELLRVWFEYKDCKEAACSKPLPKNLQESAQQEKAITDNETKRVDEYYSDPGAIYF
jgi:arylsulfatase A-like enzyme